MKKIRRQDVIEQLKQLSEIDLIVIQKEIAGELGLLLGILLGLLLGLLLI